MCQAVKESDTKLNQVVHVLKELVLGWWAQLLWKTEAQCALEVERKGGEQGYYEK